jgi:hypothetical protein
MLSPRQVASLATMRGIGKQSYPLCLVGPGQPTPCSDLLCEGPNCRESWCNHDLNFGLSGYGPNFVFPRNAHRLTTSKQSRLVQYRGYRIETPREW